MTDPAPEVVALLLRRGQTVAAAESLTGGLVCAALTAVPGSSAVLTGGIVAYTPPVKTALADVPAKVIEEFGLVSAQVAGALARGAARRCGADWGVGTTGAAGPDPHDDADPGTVWVCVSDPDGAVTARRYRFEGDRRAVRDGAVVAALALLRGRLAADVSRDAPTE